MEFYGLPPIEQKALDGWGTVSFPVGRQRRWATKRFLNTVADHAAPGEYTAVQRLTGTFPLPEVRGDNVRGDWNPVRNAGVQDNLYILPLPATGEGLCERRDGVRIGDEFDGGTRSSPCDSCRYHDRFAGLGVQNPRDDGVVLGRVGIGGPVFLGV